MTVINAVVAASADDGRWNDSVAGGQTAFYADNDAAVTLGSAAPTYDYVSAWFRFTGIQFSGTPTISSAILTLTETGASGGDPLTFAVKAVKSDNPTAPTSGADAIARARTTASVAWSPSGSPGAVTVDIASVIQEIANAYDYVGSAKALVVYVLAPGTAAARTYDTKDNGSNIPTLDITYTAGGGGGQVKRLRQLAGGIPALSGGI